MKALAIMAAALGVAALLSQQAINKDCPVKGSPVKAGVTSTYKGKTVGFC